MKNCKLFVLLALISCSTIPEYKVVGGPGPLTTFAHKDARLHVIKINQGIKICPTPESKVTSGFYSAIRSKSNYSLRFVKQEECYWSPMELKAGKKYRVYVTMDEEKEVLFELIN